MAVGRDGRLGPSRGVEARGRVRESGSPSPRRRRGDVISEFRMERGWRCGERRASRMRASGEHFSLELAQRNVHRQELQIYRNVWYLLASTMRAAGPI